MILLLIKWKVNFFILVENTDSHIEIKSFFYHFCKNGRVTLKSKNELAYEKEEHEKSKRKSKKSNKKKKSKVSQKIKLWFLKNIRYEEVTIFEKIGVLDPVFTSYALPVVSIVTTVPFHFLNVNYQNFKYEILPDYNHFIFVLDLKAKASFRIINFLISIMKENLHKIFSRS